MAMNRGWGTPGDNRSLAHWWVDNDEPTKIYLQSLCGQYKLEYAESQEVWFKQDHPKCAACELALSSAARARAKMMKPRDLRNMGFLSFVRQYGTI